MRKSRLYGPFDGDIHPFAFNESLVDAFSSGSTLALAATEVMHFVLDLFRRINSKIGEKKNNGDKDCKAADDTEAKEKNDNKDGSGESGATSTVECAEKMDVDESRVTSTTDSSSAVNLEDRFGHILFEHLLSEFCLACFSNEWIDRTGVMDGIISLMRKMGLGWCKHFEVALLLQSSDAPRRC